MTRNESSCRTLHAACRQWSENYLAVITSGTTHKPGVLMTFCNSTPRDKVSVNFKADERGTALPRRFFQGDGNFLCRNAKAATFRA